MLKNPRTAGPALSLGPDRVEAIDWSAPWLAPYVAVGQGVAVQVAAGVSSAQALNAALAPQATPVRFVPQSDLPPGQAYESYIFESNCCPTREGLHDFFNGLAWLQFPLTKRRLNHLHVAQIAQTGIQPVRGPARDALTVFDENAAFLQAPDALWDALAAKDWHRLFVELRPLWQQAHLLLFGHALLEKLVAPRKPITTHVYRAQAASNSIAELDAWMAADLSADKLAGKPFAHLPVLGVPGWWAANEASAFYADSSVFRPLKTP
ncbi:MAG: DUF3025 domain-containing protein [Rhodoferax sp.]|nr:DUF3025 domain-containing protein [Rhodoferax sp.]MDP3654570.1 DUF3025 domain-containing protein [Rhodoferax sp.]